MLPDGERWGWGERVRREQRRRDGPGGGCGVPNGRIGDPARTRSFIFSKKGWAYRQLTAGLKRFNHDDSDPGIRYIPDNGQSTGDENIMLHSVVSSETSWGRNE
jgi:hypothetical protein